MYQLFCLTSWFQANTKSKIIFYLDEEIKSIWKTDRHHHENTIGDTLEKQRAQ